MNLTVTTPAEGTTVVNGTLLSTVTDIVTIKTMLQKHSVLNVNEVKHSVNQTALIGYLITLITAGVLGNSTVIFSIARYRKFHRAPFYFMLQVSVIDISKTVFCLPLALSVVYNDFEWTFGQQACVFVAFTNSFFPLASSIGLMAAAIERHLSMSSPRFHNKCSHGFAILFVTVLGWGIAFCLSFPPVFKQNVYKFIEEEIQCTFNHQQYRKNDTLSYTILFTGLLLVTLLIHWRFCRFLRSHRRMAPLYHKPATSPNWNFLGPGANQQGLINLLNGFTGGPPAAFANAAQNFQHFGRVVHLRPYKNEHLTRAFFISSLFLAVLWMPYLFQVFITVFLGPSALSVKFKIVSTLMSHAHVTLCPMVYLAFKNPLRQTIFERFKSIYECIATDEQQTDTALPEHVGCTELEV